jgi:glycolate oxidase iron-sulfur subunit
MANYLRPELAEKAVSLLSRRFTVLIPPEQGCCGLPAVSAGLNSSAENLAAKNLSAFSLGEPDLIITTCGSCAFALAMEMPRLVLEPDREKAFLLAAKVREISQVLAEEPGLVQGLARPGEPVAVHDPCHLKLGLSVSEEPRQMLKTAGAELVPMQGQDECCGGGGLLPANEPDLANRIFNPRKEAFAQSGALVLATSCSGCFAQWRRGLLPENPVVHPLELLNI